MTKLLDIHMYMFWCEHKFLFSLGKYPRMGFLGCISICLTNIFQSGGIILLSNSKI